METKEPSADLKKLTLERCDELEDMAVKMAREISHLKAMLVLADRNRGTEKDTCKQGKPEEAT